jgi:hypothetical protein
MRLISRLAALILLAIITFATLSPIQMRPHFGDPDIERGLAYFLLGLALAFGFPSRLTQTLMFVVAVAAGLELLQATDPGRHARVNDAAIKAAAGLVGIAAGQILFAAASKVLARR